MCGIAGIIGDRHRTASSEPIDRMIDLMPYRGPDGRGTVLFSEDGVALGHRRLSIIDPKPSGAQPMATTDGRYCVVFNGEIYNYREIRSVLENGGHVFRSRSDTEVLLAAYAAWGERCLERFVGMFAFAIWDTREKILFAARDRLGVKPFYFARDRDTLLFASEIKAILSVDSEHRGIDQTLIDAYMSFGYVPGETTMFKGISRLLPGYCLTWSAGELSVRQYWDFDFDRHDDKGLTVNTAEVEQLLRDSIELRLRSDVPLGVFLSGGLDSSTVVSLLAPGAAQGLKTFSVAYDFGPAYDETPYARQVARAFNTDHHEVVVTPREFLEFIPRFVWHMDEPVTEAAAISLYHVSRLAREQVVVCLSGEGSDELFAGYDFYAYNLAIERVRSLLGSGLLGGVSRLGQRLSLPRKLGKYLDLAARPLAERYKGISSHEESVKERLYSREFAASARSGNPSVQGFIKGLFARSRDWDPLSRMLYFDTKTWLVDDLLIKADRMSMATSIELRVPFLDHRLVEYAATLPSRYKMNGRDPKFILKQVVKDRLPENIIRRKKMGFPTPLEIMLKGELYDYCRDRLLSRKAVQRGYFCPSAVEQLLENHRSGREKNQREIWQLLVLEEWCQQFHM
jgi:asparagine synthase (glutamine-hydrolysing)